MHNNLKEIGNYCFFNSTSLKSISIPSSVKTIGDLAKIDRNLLVKKFGKHGNLMWEYANGIDNSEINVKICSKC